MKNEQIKEIQATLGLLKAGLAGILAESSRISDREVPTYEDLLDLLEERVSATEREDLIDRLAASPETLEQMADLLEGYRLEDELLNESPFAEFAPSPLAALRTWLENCLAFLTPAVTAYSSTEAGTVDLLEYARESHLYELIDFSSLDASFTARAEEIGNLLENGLESGELLHIQAAVMEVHLVLSRDRGGAPAGFMAVWRRVSEQLGLGGLIPSVPAEDAEGWRQSYDLIRGVYLKALELNPQLSEAYIGLGRIGLQVGELDQAEAHLDKGVSLAPAEASVYHLLNRVRALKEDRKG